MLHCGIDLAGRESALCLLNQNQAIVAELSVPTDAGSFRTALAGFGKLHCIVEASPLAEWCVKTLAACGHECEVVDTRHAKRMCDAHKKTDRRDALTLARMACVGWYNAVHVKSQQARLRRSLLKARKLLEQKKNDLKRHIKGAVRALGIRLTAQGAQAFEAGVRDIQNARPELALMLEALLVSWQCLRTQEKRLNEQLTTLAQASPITQLLMTVPGVGKLTAQTFESTIDEPSRFTSGRKVADYLGLTPSVYQSGEVDRKGRITKDGDKLLRSLLVEAAHSLLHNVSGQCALKAWGQRLVRKKGESKAKVAMARKLAILLWRLWLRNEAFDSQRGWPQAQACLEAKTA